MVVIIVLVAIVELVCLSKYPDIGFLLPLSLSRSTTGSEHDGDLRASDRHVRGRRGRLPRTGSDRGVPARRLPPHARHHRRGRERGRRHVQFVLFSSFPSISC